MPIPPFPAAETPPAFPSPVPPVPSWIARAPGPGPDRDGLEAPDNAAFLAGAALAHLHDPAMERTGVPVVLWRDRMALAAAAAASLRSGGRAPAGALRDRLAFRRPGDILDPEAARLALWRRAVAADLRGDAVPDLVGGALAGNARGGPDQGAFVAAWHAAGTVGAGGDPVARAAGLLARVRDAGVDNGVRDGEAALILADACLARALGWPRLLPLLGTGLSRRDLARDGADLRHACLRATLREAVRAARLAADLERRAGRLRAAAPRLRAKASGAAVALFLARDAVAPSLDLTPVVRGTRRAMSPRAAYRLCDRLVALGVVRELTGRATSRLYGL